MRNALVLYLDFTESSYNGTGDEVVDKSGQGNHGTSYRTGGVWPIPQDEGTRRICDYGNGFDTYTSVPHSASLDITDEVTVACWYYPYSFATFGAGSHVLIQKFDDVSAFFNGYGFMTTRDDTVIRWGDTYLSNCYFDMVSPGRWVCLVGTMSQGDIKLYVDNQLVDEAPNTPYFISNSDPLLIIAGKAARQSNGKLAQVAIWNRIVTEEERNAFWCGGHGMKGIPALSKRSVLR